MANVLGQLLIELKANTDQFTKGIQSARDLAFTSSSEIANSFRKIGESVARLRFENSAQITRSLGIIGGVAAATAAGVTAATVAIAKQTAETAEEISKLSQSYGLTVEQISSLRVASKMTHVDLNTLSRGMGMLAMNAHMAATGSKTMAMAFEHIGVKTTDAQGRLRPMNDLLLDIGDKFSKMEGGTTKTGLAMEVFGKRVGAQMLPFLNAGSEGIKRYIDLSAQLGMTWTEKDIAAAVAFNNQLDILELKTEAFKEQLAMGVIPALTQIADEFLKADINGRSLAKTLGEDVGGALEHLARTLDTIITGFKQFSLRLIDVGDAILSISQMSATKPGTNAGVFAGYLERREGRKKEWEQLNEEWVARMAASYSPPTTLPFYQPQMKNPPPSVTGGEQKKDIIAETIAKLKQQTEAQLSLAAAEQISELSVRNTTIANKEENLALETAIKYAHEHKTSVESAYEMIQRKYGAQLTSLITTQTEAQAQQELSKSLRDSTDKAEQDASATLNLAAAELQGGDAVRKATIENQLLAIQHEAFRRGVTLSVERLNEYRTALESADSAKITESLNKETTSLTRTTEATQLMITAQRQGTELETEAYIKAVNFALQQNIPLTDERIAALEQEYLAQLKVNETQKVVTELRTPGEKYAQQISNLGKLNLTQEEYARAVAQIQVEISGMHDPAVAYAADLARIADLEKLVDENGKPLLTGTARWVMLTEAAEKYKDGINRVSLETKSWAEGMSAAFRDIARDSKDMARVAYEAWTRLFEEVSRGLADLVIDGEADFKRILDDFNKTILTGIIKAKITGPIFDKLGKMLGIPGLGKQRGDDPSYPLFVQNVGSLPAGGMGGPGGTGGPGGAGGILGSVLDNLGLGGAAGTMPDGTQGNPFYVRDADQAIGGGMGGGIVNSILGGVGGIFGMGGEGGGGIFAATGGVIPGTGSQDTVPAMLTPGEGVVNLSGMKILGVKGLDALNRGMNFVGEKVKHFATGGLVSPTLAYAVGGVVPTMSPVISSDAPSIINFSPVTNIDARGVDPATEARMRRELDARDRRLANQIVQATEERKTRTPRR